MNGATANKGRCGTCGFLGKRVIPNESTGQRSHLGFFEAEQTDRDKPAQLIKLVPGESNAWQDAHLVCFRYAADLPKEIAEIASLGDDVAARDVVWKDRHCPLWCAYEPGLSPRDHLYELKARDLEEHRRQFQRSLATFESRQAAREKRADRRLTKAAIWFGSIVGVAQIIASLMTMPPDAWLREKFAHKSLDGGHAVQHENQPPAPGKPPAAGIGG
jgi:hypothetical protein